MTIRSSPPSRAAHLQISGLKSISKEHTMHLRRTFLLLLILSASLPALAQNEGGPESPDPLPQAHPTAITYSEAYQTRLKIHKYASYATLPLFATELALGQSLYNNPDTRGGATKTLHGVVGTEIVGLFGVNSV